jgi:hypothetical protein
MLGGMVMRLFFLIVSVLVGSFILSACGPTVGKAIGETPNNTPDANQLSLAEINTPYLSVTPIVATATLLPTSTPLPTVTLKPTQVLIPTATPIPLLPDTKTVLENSKGAMDRLSSYRYKGTMVIAEPISGFELPLNFNAIAQPPDNLSEKFNFEMMGMLLEGEERKVGNHYFSLEPMEETWNEGTFYDGPDFAAIWSGSGEEESLFELPLSGTPTIEGYAGKEAYLIEWDLIESLGDPSLANNFLSFFDFDATEDSLDDMEKFHITYWIDSSTFYLLRLELEIAMRDDAMLAGMLEIDLFDFDQANEPILKPQNLTSYLPAPPPPVPLPTMPPYSPPLETLAPLTSYPAVLRVEGHFSLDGSYTLKWDGDLLETHNGMPQWINTDCGMAFGCFIYYHKPVPSSIRHGKTIADGVWALTDAVPSDMWVMNAYYDSFGYPWEVNLPGWRLIYGTSLIEGGLTVEAFGWPDDNEPNQHLTSYLPAPPAPVPLPTMPPYSPPTVAPTSTATPAVAPIATPVNYRTFINRNNGLIFVLPQTWERKVESGGLQIFWSDADLMVLNVNSSNQDLGTFVENWFINKPLFVETKRTEQNNMQIITGSLGRVYRQFVFIENASNDVSIFAFGANPDYLENYVPVFKEIRDSIEIDASLIP